MLVDMRPVESSENITIMDEIDELLGTRRSYGWNSGSRPSMISAKYRLKEERRKVLKISVNKMKKIDDAESSLCRSVLINNTVKRLQAETRDDRTTGRTSPASPPSPTSAGYGYHSPQQSQPCGGGPGGNPQLVDITNLRESPTNNGVGGVGGGVVSVGKTLQANNNNNNNNNNVNNNNNNKSLTDAQSSSLASDQLHHLQQQHNHHHHHHHHHQNNHHHHHHLQHHQHHHQSSSQHPYEYDDDDDVDDDDVDEDDEDDTIASIMMQLPSSTGGGGSKRKRPVDEPLDDLLSQFINNSQREDEDVNVVDLDLHEYPAAKRLRTDEAAAAAAAAAAEAAAGPSNAGPASASVSSCSSSPATDAPSSSSSSAATTPSTPSPSAGSSSAAEAAAAAAAAAADLCSSDCWSLMDTCCGDDTLDLYGGQVPAAVEHQDVLLPAVVAAAAAQSAASSSPSPAPPTDCCGQLLASASQDEHGCYGSAAAGSTSPTNLSCGQASMFSEMQSAMFRNLIASLES